MVSSLRSEQRIIVPSQRGTKSLSQTFSLTVPIWWNDLSNSIRAVLNHLQEMAKNTSLLSLFDPLPNSSTLYSNSILFFVSISLLCIYLTLTSAFYFSNLSTYFLKNKLFSFLFYLFSFIKKMVYCVRLTETCHSASILFLFCWF